MQLAKPEKTVIYRFKSIPRAEKSVAIDFKNYRFSASLEQTRMGPGGRLCHFHNAPQDGDSARVAEAAHSHRHLATNAGPCNPQPPLFAISNPGTEKDDPGWSTSETSSTH